METFQELTPVAFVSHGSPWMCCKESESSKWWSEASMHTFATDVQHCSHDFQLGRQALAHKIKGVVFIGAHWEELDDSIRVATKLNPQKAQMDMVDPQYWKDYPVNVSPELAERVISLLRDHHFKDVKDDPTFDWHDDTITPARWMFPDGTPPATVVSLNARFNPIFHVKIGRALSQLRKEGIFICGTGGAVHNLYRNNWLPMLAKGDNFQHGRVPAEWAVDFERTVSDVVSANAVG
jgi:aromatic ring-opening dioxygenase catalytic subunit (LigB family)